MPDKPTLTSLYDKTQGPNSVPVTELIARAEEAVAAVKQEYLPFVRARLSNLEAMSKDADADRTDARWSRLSVAAQDLRSSSATAGYDQLSAIAASLEWLVNAAPVDDSRVVAVVRLHLDAIRLLVEDNAPHLASPQVQEVLTELARASNHVTRGL